jgi:hypothetical protein
VLIRCSGTILRPDTLQPVKAKFDDHVITVQNVVLPDGLELPIDTHGFVTTSADDPERYEVEFDVDGEAVLVWVGPEDFGVA